MDGSSAARTTRLTRRTLLLGALRAAACVGLLGRLTAQPAPASAAPPRSAAASADWRRADAAYDVMQQRFLLTGTSLYTDARQTNPKLPLPYASNWSFSVAMRATLALARLRPDQASYGQALDRLVRDGLEWYWDQAGRAYNSDVQPPLGIPFGEHCFRFYDDNAHVGLLLLEYAQQRGDRWALRRTVELFDDFIVSGFDTSNPVMAGGIRWAQTPDGKSGADRCLVSNAPNALLGLSLYQQTGEQRFFDRALQVLAWCARYLRDEQDGLYWDKIRADGTIDRTKWSYNQGFVLGSYIKLYEILQREDLLRTAESIAAAALRYHQQYVRNGVVGLLNQDPDFNAVFFRHLLPLLTLSADQGLHTAIRRAIVTYRDQAWESPEYHLPDGQFSLPCGSTPLRMQAGMAEIYAINLG